MSHVCRECGHETLTLSVPCTLCGSSDVVGVHAVALPGSSVTTSPSPVAPSAVATAYFHVGPAKLAIMSTATFCVYQIYWMYMQWRCVRAREGKISPFWRTFFSGIFAYALFRRVRREADEAGVEPNWSAGPAAFLFVVISMLWRLPDPYWLVGLFNVVPLVAVQRTILEAHEARGLPASAHAGYSGWDRAGVCVGVLMWVLVVWAFSIPDEV